MLTLTTTTNLTPVVKSVELPSGVKLSYVEQGDPSAIPVLFLHGVTDSWRSFELVLPHLPGSIHAFALSLRGHGDSDRPMASYHAHDFTADVVAFIDTLKLGPVVIAGHSMGSLVAQRFAIDHPEHILGLVLIGSSATPQTSPALLEVWDEVVLTLTDPIDPDFVLEFQESTLAQPIPPVFLNTVVQESLKVPAWVWKAAFKGILEADSSGKLGKIKASTLTIWGDQDALFSRNDQEVLAVGIADMQFVVYPGAGHAAHWEEPERVAADLVAFIEKLAR